ncbi:MAG TPA: hypothetical protein VGG44_00545, partial [Tepidisphaeraceae bacterium]
MSYDLTIWSVHPFATSMLGQSELWEQRSETQSGYLSTNWQIVIGASNKVLPEDIPPGIEGLLPGIRWLTCMNLEGRATKNAKELLTSTAKKIAKAAHGVISDNQEDT